MDLNWNIAMIAWIGSFFDDHDDEMEKLKEVAIAR